MVILAIETSSKKATISIFKEGIHLGCKYFAETDSVSALLLPKISELLLDNDLGLSDVELIVVSTGPGSLTGMRIGIAVGEGLANSLGIKCFGVSLLDAMTVFEDTNENLSSLISVGGNNFYWQYFANGEKSEISFGGIEALKENCRKHKDLKILTTNMLADDLVNLAEIKVVEPLSKFVGTKGIEIVKDNQNRVVPMYVRETNFKKVNPITEI